MSFVYAVLALGFLIFVHELGHFLIAKFFNVQVLEFAIGFGPRVIGWRWGETLYSLRLIPLGGYVRMAGESLSEMEEVLEGGDDAVFEEVAPDKDRWFISQGYFPKFSIVAAGPLSNLFFAVLLAWFSFFLFGKPDYVKLSRIGDVMKGLPAEQAGLQAGDLVTSVNGNAVSTWKDLATAIRTSEGHLVKLYVERDGDQVVIPILPTLEKTELDALMDEKEPRYKIGIFPATTRQAIGFFQSGYYGARQVYWVSTLTLKGLYGMIAGNVSANSIAGPLFIFQQGAAAAKTGMDRLIEFMVFLSVSLAILNLLPIPVLDGGHLLFFTIEALRGKPNNQLLQERATQLGMLALLLLMVFAVSNDVRRFLG